MKGIVDFFFSKDNRSNQNVLAGQVAIEPGRVVSPDKVSLFVKKEKKKAVVKKKPFVAKDGVTRVKVKVRFELLPNHLKIRAKKYHDLVDENSKRFMLQRQLILAVIHTESYFNPLAASHAGAHGLMQLIPKYGAREHTGWCMAATGWSLPNTLYIPENNVDLGSAYLSLLTTRSFEQIPGRTKRLYLVICAYNWGPGAVTRKIVRKNNISLISSHDL